MLRTNVWGSFARQSVVSETLLKGLTKAETNQRELRTLGFCLTPLRVLDVRCPVRLVSQSDICPVSLKYLKFFLLYQFYYHIL